MRIIVLDAQNKVSGFRDVSNDHILADYERVSDEGELGQILQSDGTFTNEITKEPKTTQEQLDQIKQDQLTLMDAMAQMYEDMMAKGTV